MVLPFFNTYWHKSHIQGKYRMIHVYSMVMPVLSVAMHMLMSHCLANHFRGSWEQSLHMYVYKQLLSISRQRILFHTLSNKMLNEVSLNVVRGIWWTNKNIEIWIYIPSKCLQRATQCHPQWPKAYKRFLELLESQTYHVLRYNEREI